MAFKQSDFVKAAAAWTAGIAILEESGMAAENFKGETLLCALLSALLRKYCANEWKQRDRKG